MTALMQAAEARGRVRHWAEASEVPPPGLSRIGRLLCRVSADVRRAEDVPGAARRPMCRPCFNKMLKVIGRG